MDEATKTYYQSRADVFKALAHPTRLFIVDMLANGEKCVCELDEKIDADMSTISKHLSVLTQAGVISRDKRGNQVFYSLKIPCVLNFFSCVDSVIKSHAEDFGRMVR